MTSPASDLSEKTTTERATQEEFNEEVQRVQSLIAHIQQHATRLKDNEASPQRAEKVHEAEELLERAETLLEQAEEL